MGRKMRSLLKGIALIIATVSVLTHIQILNIPQLYDYSFWLMVIAFGLVLLVSK